MTARDRRALAWGATAVTVAVLILRVAPWLGEHAVRFRQEVVRDAERLARMREEIEESKALEDSAAAVRGRLVAIASRLLTGGRVADAQADLRSRVEAAVSRSRVQLVRTEAAPDSTSIGSLRRASLKVSLQGDNAGILGVLAGLVRDSAALVAREVSIVAVNPRAVAREVLNAELLVTGWFVTGKAP
jgi:hypothetical protein